MGGAPLNPERHRHLTLVPEAAEDDRHRPAQPPLLIAALAGRAVAPALAGDPSVETYRLRLPGIGGRWLAGIAAEAAARGWPATDVVALVAAVEDRTCMWLAAPNLGRLVGAGLLGRARLPRRRAGAMFEQGLWRWARCDGESLVSALTPADAAVTRIAAVSGARPPADLVRALESGGCRSGRLDTGLAAAMGTRWAVELVVGPTVSAAGLGVLRDQIAGAPRCSWCRTPVLGVRCPRCAGGDRR